MTEMMAAAVLIPGDLVDLEGDKYADPKHDNVHLASEYVEVSHVDWETGGCVAIGFEGFDTVGFPMRHKVKIVSLLGQSRFRKHAPTMGEGS